jgi:aminopeptidase C
MSNEWFNDYGYFIVIHKSKLTNEELAIYNKIPRDIPITDPLCR